MTIDETKWQIGVVRAMQPTHEIMRDDTTCRHQMSAVIEHADGRVTAVSVAPGRTIHTQGDEPQPGFALQFSRRNEDGQWETLRISLSDRAASALGSLLSLATCDEPIGIRGMGPPTE